MPYYMGRIDRNYVEKANTRINMRKPPIEYLRMLYFDSCVYERAVLQHLVQKVGADRILLGSDYPVGETKPVDFVAATDALSQTQQRQIIRSNARALFGLDGRRATWTNDDRRGPAQSDLHRRARAPLGRGTQGNGGAQDRRALDAEQQRLARRPCTLVHRHAVE